VVGNERRRLTPVPGSADARQFEKWLTPGVEAAQHHNLDSGLGFQKVARPSEKSLQLFREEQVVAGVELSCGSWNLSGFAHLASAALLRRKDTR
jgi:hypothetical protein